MADFILNDSVNRAQQSSRFVQESLQKEMNDQQHLEMKRRSLEKNQRSSIESSENVNVNPEAESQEETELRNKKKRKKRQNKKEEQKQVPPHFSGGQLIDLEA